MQLDTREFRAEARFQRVSPQKARLVLELIKGRRVEEALKTVAFTKKGVAPLVEKVLRSALQNANYLSEEQGLDVDVDNLYVKTAVANDGPRMKRIRPAPMGRAFRYQRRLSHIVISVAERKTAELVETVGEPDAAPRRSASSGSRRRRRLPRRPQQRCGEGQELEQEGHFGEVSRGREARQVSIRSSGKTVEGLEETMGQKVHPYGFRLGVNKPWRSRWFVERDYDKLLIEDVKLKRELKEKLKAAGVSSVEIERPGNKLRLIIRTARPGIVIGRKGAEIDKLKVRAAEAHQPRCVHRHSRGEQAGAGRAAGRGEHRAAAGEARRLPPRDAQVGRFGAAFWLQGHQGPRFGPFERQRDRAFGVVSAGTSAAAHAARGHRLRFLPRRTRPTASSA